MKLALISDTHVADRAVAFTDNLRATLDDIRREQCDLIIHLGDITADGIRDPAEFGQAKALFAHAPAPVLFLPGNHDIGDNPLPGEANRAAETQFDPRRLDQYRAVFGADYWSVAVNGWRLLGLNAQLFGSGTPDEAAQFAWATAEAATDEPVVLFLHKPLVLESPADTPVHPRYAPPAARDRLLELFAGTDVRLVASGHVHQRRRKPLDGVDHLWTPAVAFVIPDHMQERIGEKQTGYVILSLVGAEHNLRFIRPLGVSDHSLSDFPEVYPELREE